MCLSDLYKVQISMHPNYMCVCVCVCVLSVVGLCCCLAPASQGDVWEHCGGQGSRNKAFPPASSTACFPCLTTSSTACHSHLCCALSLFPHSHNVLHQSCLALHGAARTDAFKKTQKYQEQLLYTFKGMVCHILSVLWILYCDKR